MEDENRHVCPHCGHELESRYNQDPISFGEWETEKESVAVIRDILVNSGMFKIYDEVDGELMQPRLHAEKKDMRIDMILSPTSDLIKKGWTLGPVGLECKRSGVKLNEPLAQVMDYQRTVWTVDNGFRFMYQYSFLWPYYSAHGLAASIMAQQRIGTVELREGHEISFWCGEQWVLRYNLKDRTFKPRTPRNGNKSGSR